MPASTDLWEPRIKTGPPGNFATCSSGLQWYFEGIIGHFPILFSGMEIANIAMESLMVIEKHDWDDTIGL
jgi:hypothetical protein